MSNVTPIKPGGVPADLSQLTAEQMISAIEQSRSTTVIAGGGKPFLRLLKSNEWVYGAENIDVQPGSRWVVNIFEAKHGFCCWVDNGPGKKNELKGEVMSTIFGPKPHRPDPIDGTPFAEQRAFDLKCVDGEDAGVEVHYKTASIGGMKATDELLKALTLQLGVDRVHCCPVITLDSDYYDHPKYGRTYVPIFTVHGWADINGTMAGTSAIEAPTAAPAEDPTPAPEPVKTRQRRAPVSPPAPEAPTPTAQVHVGQRRRPAR